MEAVYDFFVAIGDVFSIIIDIIWNLLVLLWDAISFIFTAFGNLPSSLRMCIYEVVVISIAYKIISMGGSSSE